MANIFQALTGGKSKPLARSLETSFLTRNREQVLAYLFILPVVLHLLTFKYYPVIYSAALSLHKGTLLNPFKRYLGFYHYKFLFTNKYFLRALINTGLYTLGSVPIAAGFGIILAILVFQNHRGRVFFRVIYYTPVVVSVVAMVQIWLWLFNPEHYGLLNMLLEMVGLPRSRWLYHPDTALLSLIFMSYWTVAFNMVIYLAALTGIPSELYEAARVDGANAWQQFWRITLPALMPTTFFVVIVSTINAFKYFVPIVLMTGGGPMQSTTMVAYQIYEAAFEFNLWGRASAQAFLFFAIVVAVTVVQYKFMPESFE